MFNSDVGWCAVLHNDADVTVHFCYLIMEKSARIRLQHHDIRRNQRKALPEKVNHIYGCSVLFRDQPTVTRTLIEYSLKNTTN